MRLLGPRPARALVVALLATGLASGCGDPTGPGLAGVADGPVTAEDLRRAELTRTLGCGEGFVAVDDTDRIEVLVAWTGDTAGALPQVVELPATDWVVEVRVGTNLTNNYCQDVILEPERVVQERWPVTGATLTFTGTPPEGDPGYDRGPDVHRAVLSDVRVDVEGEAVVIDDLALETRDWGFHPG